VSDYLDLCSSGVEQCKLAASKLQKYWTLVYYGEGGWQVSRVREQFRLEAFCIKFRMQIRLTMPDAVPHQDLRALPHRR
jgi:hypothetical protein